MGARNCARCSKVFDYVNGPPLCPSCRSQDENDFKKVRDYLYDNPESTIVAVSKELNVSIKKINRFIKEGRLEIKRFKNISMECRSCGKPIDTGEYCDKCKHDLTNNLKAASKGQSNNESSQHTQHYEGFLSRRDK